MRKMKYILVGCLAVVLIISISALPFGISAIMDSTNQNESHFSNMDTIQLNLSGDPSELSEIQKLHLVGCGKTTELPENQATLTPKQVQQYIVDNLQRYEETGLISGSVADLVMVSCKPVLHYNEATTEQYNIFWIVNMSASAPSQSLELLVDDSTGAIYKINYSCDAESADENAYVDRIRAEYFASCFFDALELEYTITRADCLDNNMWTLTAACAGEENQIVIDFVFYNNGFYCEIKS